MRHFRFRFLFPLVLFVMMVAGFNVLGAEPSLWVNPEVQYQTIDGFGASIAFVTKEVFVMKEPYRTQVLDLLFKDLGTTILRFKTDVNTESMNDNADPFVTDWNNLHFNKDAAQVFVTKQAIARGIKTIISSTWSPPAWMKDNGMLQDGGHVKPECYEEYAEWAAAYIKGYKEKHGINIDVFSITNEPDLATTYDSLLVTPDEYVSLAKAIRNRFKKEGITTKLAGPETMGTVRAVQGFAPKLLAEPRSLDIMGVHTYAENDLPTLAKIGQQYQIPLWVTEWSKLRKDKEKGIDESLTLASHIHEALAIGNVNAFLYWGYWWDEVTPQGLIIASGLDSYYETTKRYYMFKQFSKFIRPGMVRIDAGSDFPTLKVSAYKNDKNLTMVIINKSGPQQKIQLNLPGDGTLDIYETSEEKDSAKTGSIAIKGGQPTSLTIPANAMLTLSGPWKHNPALKVEKKKETAVETPAAASSKKIGIADFESSDGQIGSYNGPKSSIAVTASSENVHNGAKSAKVTFACQDWVGATWTLTQGTGNWNEMKYLRFWMYGDDSGILFNFVLEDAGDEQFQLTSPLRVDWSGWKQISIPLAEFQSRTDWQASHAKVNRNLDYNIKGIHFFTNNQGEGTYFIDDIEVTGE